MQRSFVFFLVALGSWAFEKGFAEEKYVRIWPENPVVEFGGSLQINCSASTEAEEIGLETPFIREIIGTGSNWKAFRVTNISDWNKYSLCYVKDYSAKAAKTTITVYKSPESIKLDPVPEMEVDKQYNLTCRVLGVAPIRDLTVVLLKGEEQLLVKTFQDHTQPEAGAVVVNHHIRAQQNDYNKTIICQTSLDLRPRGPLLKNTSPGISLRTFDFAKAPLLHTGLFLEAGTLMKVTCDAPEVFPAKEAMFDLWFAGETQTYNTTVMGSLASAQAVISSSSVGEHELICRVSLGPVTKNVTKMVNVFALPKLTFQIGSSEAVINQTVNITCSADGSASPGFKMQITDAAKILAFGNVDEHFLQHAVIAQQEDNEREFICQVTLTVDGHTKERNISQNLTVFYGPQMDDSNCPHALTWKEGSTTSFTCSAMGNPTPTVQCWKDGKPYSIGEPQLVQKEHDGIYHCNATNQYGFDVRDVTIHVEYAITGRLEQMTLELQKLSPGQSWSYNLICHIIRVNPCLSLVVTFFKGSKRLGTPSFTNCTWAEIKNYTVTLPVTLHPEDHAQEAYCHAAVRFSPQEPIYQTKSSEVSLKTAESYLAIIVAVTAVAALLVCVLVVFLIFIIKLWIN